MLTRSPRAPLFAALAALALGGCVEQANPPNTSLNTTPASGQSDTAAASPLVLVADTANGQVVVIRHAGDTDNSVSQKLAVGVSPGDITVTARGHIFVNVTGSNLVAALDPENGQLSLNRNIAAGTRPVHGFLDPDGTRVWALNDGDGTSGADPIRCAASGSGSATVIEDSSETGDHAARLARHAGEDHGGDTAGGDTDSPAADDIAALAHICLGKGHKKAAFSVPSADLPATPRRAFISNLKDGTVSVVDNEPASATYLSVLATIDLCDASKAACDGDSSTPNGAVPHGLAFSPLSGKIYNANVGYGTVAVIDPAGMRIEKILDIGFANKIHLSPGGRFLVTKGADTSGNPNHVIGKLAVVDLLNDAVTPFDLSDIYPDDFVFTPDGGKLYLATASGGSAAQKANLKNNVVLVYDLSTPGAPTLIKEIAVGATDGGHRALALHAHDGLAKHLFVPNAADGTVSIIKISTDEVVQTVDVDGKPGAISVYLPPVSAAADHDASTGEHAHALFARN